METAHKASMPLTTKPTSGNWAVFRHGDRLSIFSGRSERLDRRGVLICQDGASHMDSPEDGLERLANMHLASKAPEMHAALRAIVACLAYADAEGKEKAAEIALDLARNGLSGLDFAQ